MSIDSAGNFNADTYLSQSLDDLVIGDPDYQNGKGAVYIYHGKKHFAGSIDASNLPLQYVGGTNARAGQSVVGNTDFNGDKIADVGATEIVAGYAQVTIFNGAAAPRMEVTGLIADVNKIPNNIAFAFGATVVVGQQMYFVLNDQTLGEELWVTDGTDEGTRLVKDIRPGTSSSSPLNLTNVDGLLYFSADDGVNGRELWVSDGTDTGTNIVANLNSSAQGSSNPVFLTYFMTASGTKELLFRADSTSYGSEVFVLVKGFNTKRYRSSSRHAWKFTDSDRRCRKQGVLSRYNVCKRH